MRRLLLIPVLLLVLLIAAPATASDEPAGAPAGDSVEAVTDGPVPAIVVPADTGAEEDTAWTFRYLVPTLLALAVLTVGGVILFYGFRVKGRYRVVG